MTAQIKDILNYKSKRYLIASEPLFFYLKKLKSIDFFSFSTACLRGYLAVWEIRDKKLFLINLDANIQKDDEKYKVGVDYLFPSKNEVFADWFNGDIRIPTGKQLKYIHLGYKSIFEKDIYLNFKDGILLSERIHENKLDSEA
jgi:hypothetical protein